MASNRKVSVGSILGIGALSLFGVAVVIAFATFWMGMVTGSEFNPQTFERRQFVFFEIPLVRLQVTPILRSESNGEVEELVQTEKYVQPETPAADPWHLVWFRRSSYAPTTTDAQILERYLDAFDSNRAKFWHDWSNQHSDLAAALWPEVARLARLDLYILLPPLFDLALNAKDAKQFQPALKKLVADSLRDTADRLQKKAAAMSDPKLKAEAEARATLLLKHVQDFADL